MSIKAVLFDLGETLFTYGDVSVNGLFKEGARLTYDYLKEYLPPSRPMVPFWRYNLDHLFSIRWRYARSMVTHREFNCMALLDRKARGLRITLNDGQLEELAGLWYKPLSDVAVIEDNLHETLGTLRDMGLRLAVLSNTFLPPGVLDGHLEKHKILDYFSTTIYSSETLVRKPNPQIYQFALDAMEIDGPEAIMVGDRLREDVRGPEQLGIKGIFKRGIVNRNKRIPSDVIAINRIDELPDVITGMSQTS